MKNQIIQNYIILMIDSWNKFEELYIGKDVSLESFNKEYIAIWKDFEDKIEKEN